jgi:hypothetical protein
MMLLLASPLISVGSKRTEQTLWKQQFWHIFQIEYCKSSKWQHTLPRSIHRRIQTNWTSRYVAGWLVPRNSKDRGASIFQAWPWQGRHHDLQRRRGPLP